MHPKIRTASVQDIQLVLANLKPDDAEELSYLDRAGPKKLAKVIHRMAVKVYAWGPEDKPLAVFGVTDGGDGMTGYVWALSTPDIYSEWREVHRASPSILSDLGQGFLILTNVKNTSHTHHIRWLRALGFTFISTITLGDKTVHEFVRMT